MSFSPPQGPPSEARTVSVPLLRHLSEGVRNFSRVWVALQQGPEAGFVVPNQLVADDQVLRQPNPNRHQTEQEVRMGAVLDVERDEAPSQAKGI